VWVLAVVLWLRLEDPDQALPWGYNRLGFSQRASESVVDTILPSDYRVWVYRLGQSNRVYYLAFMHEKLQRIYDVKCWQDNPDCE
jgi:hypothetical protein